MQLQEFKCLSSDRIYRIGARANKLKINPAAVVFIFIGLVAWVIAFGGLIASTKFCDQVNKAGYCGQLFQLEWYSIWFELAILLAMLFTCFHDSFERGRYIFLCYLSMATFFLTLTARDFISNSFKSGEINLANFHSDAYTATSAGTILLCIVNYMLIIFVGINAAKVSSFIPMEGAGMPHLSMPNISMPNMPNMPNMPKFNVPGNLGFGSAQQKYQASSTQAF
eukprot:gene14747-20795_t